VARAGWELESRNGRFPLTAPTLLVLKELWEERERHGSLAELLRNERGRRVPAILPKLLGDIVVLPWDREYHDLPGEGLALDETARAKRAGWPGRVAAGPASAS
jgi:hypothetical protein